MGSDFFQSSHRYIEKLLQEATDGKMATYGSMISLIIYSSVVLYMLVRGYQIMAGKGQRPVEDLGYDVVKMAIICTFINNADGYLDMCIEAINGLKQGFSGSNDIWALLDQIWGSAQKVASTLLELDPSSYVKMDGGLGALFTFIGVAIALLITTFVFMSAEIGLLLLTTTAPIFIFCLMFGFLRQMFNNWLQSVFSSILTILFSTLALSAAITYLTKILDKMSALAAESNLMTLGLMAGLAGAFCGLVVLISAKIATQLAGVGVEGAVQGAMAMGVMGGTFTAAKTLSGSTGLAKNMGIGAYEGGKGKNWSDRESSGVAAAVAYGSGRIGRAAIQKVISKNNSSSGNIPTSKIS